MKLSLKISYEEGTYSIETLLALLVIWRCNYCTSALFPAFSAPIFISVYVVWLALAIRSNRKLGTNILFDGLQLICFLMINLTLNFVFLGSIGQETINYIIVFICFGLYERYKTRDLSAFKKGIVVFILVDLCIKVIYTIGLLAENPAIVKQSSVAGASAERTVSILAADYSTVYTCVLIATFLLYVFVKSQNSFMRWFYLAVFVLLTYFVFNCSFFFALLLLFYGVLAVFFIKRPIWFIITPIIFFALVVIFKNPISTFCAYMSRQDYWSDIIRGKWYDMYLLLRFGSDAAYMSDMRLDLIIQSWETFLKYPLFGVYSLNIRGSEVGYHSGWLDGFASYGILRYSLFLAFLAKARKELLQDNKMRNAFHVACSIYLILGFINPVVFPQIWVVFFVLIPFITDTMKAKTPKVSAES